MKLINKIIDQCLPYGLFLLKRSVSNDILGFIQKQHGNWNIPSKLNSECLIIANGPSVHKYQKEILYFSKNRDIFTVNNALNQQFILSLNPRLHVIADPLYFGWLHPDQMYTHVQIFYDTINSFQKSIILAVPHKAYKIVKNKISNTNITIISYPLGKYHQYRKMTKFKLKKGLLGFGAHNVVVPALYIALMANYKKIYIVGCDMDFPFIIDEYCRAIMKYTHFYDNETLIHTGKIYYDQLYLNSSSILYKELLSVQKYALQNNIPIVNLSLNSMIDVFPKGTFDGIVYPFKPNIVENEKILDNVSIFTE
jgi:hypothetical protein